MTALSPKSTPSFPTISPAVASHRRPMFSVMIPTFEPGDLLAQSLKSVLSQGVPAEEMQIAVVDDGSSERDVAALVQSIDRSGRVEVHTHGSRAGLAGNWNRALSLAKGHLVHLLHQDDFVLPHFYARAERAFSRNHLIGMAFCRTRIVDHQGLTMKNSSRLRLWPGVISNWLPRIAVRQRLQTPAVVVARSTYEQVGGYRSDLLQTLDWEMWVRIAAHKPVWYDPRTLSVYRRHSANETSRLVKRGVYWPDIARAIRINAQSLPAELRQPITSQSARWHAGSVLRTSLAHLKRGDHEAAEATLTQGAPVFDLIINDHQRKQIENRMTALKKRIHFARRSTAREIGS
jgi:glycosyltransferase involved in cell wall biosynthesis